MKFKLKSSPARRPLLYFQTQFCICNFVFFFLKWASCPHPKLYGTSDPIKPGYAHAQRKVLLLGLYRIQRPLTTLSSSGSAGEGTAAFFFILFLLLPQEPYLSVITIHGHVFLEGETMSIDGVLKRLGAASALGCKHGSQASWGEWDTLNLLSLLTWVRWASWGGLFGKLLISIKRQRSRRPHYGLWPKSDAPVHQKADTVLFLWPPVPCVCPWPWWAREWA